MRTGLETTSVVANSSGFIAFFLLWAAIVWGILLRNGWALTRIRHTTIYAIHQTIALMGLALGVIHAVVLESSRGEQIRWIDTVVPFAGYLRIFGSSEEYFYDIDATPVDRVGIGLGVLGLELTIAAAASILIQRRIGYSRWRALHSITYASFSLIVAHIMMTGADTGPMWMWASIGSCWLSTFVLWLFAPRLMAMFDGPLGRSLGFGTPSSRQTMLVNVDTRVCARAGFCAHAAPEVFRLQHNGSLAYRARIGLDEVEAASRAVELCPVRAISLGLATASNSAAKAPNVVDNSGTNSGINGGTAEQSSLSRHHVR